MKVVYTGEVEVVCEGHVWKPKEVKDVDEDLALLLVTTNANFIQLLDDYNTSEGESE